MALSDLGNSQLVSPILLEARLKQQLEEQRRALLEGKPTPEWVFPSPRGQFWSERNFSRTWERLQRRFLKQGVRPLKFHCARHTFITWALESGKSAKRISTWVGASEEVIQSNYSHLLPYDDGVDLPTRSGWAGPTRPTG